MKGSSKKTLRLILTVLGLLLLTFAYLYIGAMCFQYLEQQNEMAACESSQHDFEATVNATSALFMEKARAINAMNSYTAAVIADVNAKYHDYLHQFSISVLGTGFRYTTNCTTLFSPGSSSTSKWNIMPAVLFSLTVVSTIGYGNIAPVTMWGRLMCMAYALLGIPIFLICLASIGELLAKTTTFVYANVCCRVCYLKKQADKPLVQEHSVPKELWQTDASGRPIKVLNQLPMRSIQVGSSGNNMAEGYTHKDGDEEVKNVETDESNDDGEETDVPATIIILLLLVVLIVGAAMFQSWEGWSFVDSIYFCFVTISTIGFGDLVPGTSSDENSVTMAFQSLAAIIYIIVGMACVSMCFQLVSDVIIAHLKRLIDLICCRNAKPKESNESSDSDDEDNPVWSLM